MIVHLTDQNFAAEVENFDGIVLVDFHALWCGPCKIQGPIVEALADKYAGKIKVAKLDVDAAPVTAEKFQVMSIPTLIFFKNGKQAGDALIGMKQPSVLESQINQLLEAK